MVFWGCALSLAYGAETGTASINGTVTDEATKQVVPDAYVTVQSPGLPADLMAVTDGAGDWRVGALPPGTYSVRVEREGYQAYIRKDVALKKGAAATVNALLAPVGSPPKLIPSAAPRPPSVDRTSGATGGSVEAAFAQTAAVVRTGDRFASGRSLELLAATLPRARTDPLGLALSGGSPLEKRVWLDGLSVTDPASGALLFPLSMEFVDAVDVRAGGTNAEDGLAASGTLLVEARSGTNEWHGSVFGEWAPGGLEGGRAEVVPRLSSLRLSEQLWNQGDSGAAISGPLLKDRLWLFLGVQGALERRKLTRRVFQYQLLTDPGSGLEVYETDGATGEEAAREVDGAERSWFADQRQLQYVAKVTWLPDVDRTVSLTLAGIPSSSGRSEGLGYDPLTGSAWGWQPASTQAMERGSGGDARALVLRGSSAFWDRQLTVDASVGWYRQSTSVGGLGPGDAADRAARVLYRGDHGLNDLVAGPGLDFNAVAANACRDALVLQAPGVRHCPVPEFAGGSIGEDRRDLADRVQGRAVATFLLNSLGHHVAKAGAEVEWLRLDRDSSFEGGTILREGNPQQTLEDFRAYGGPGLDGSPVREGANLSVTSSLGGGLFVQDSWHLVELLQLNLGLRWNMQVLTAPDGQTALSLWNQFSPRAGLVVDPLNNGRSKLYGSYARYVQAVPLDLVQRAFGGERYLLTRYRVGPGCAVPNPTAGTGAPDPSCFDPANVIDLQQYGSARPPVDAGASPTAVDELIAGAEYEVIPDLRAGASYTRRRLARSLRAISTNEGSSVFIANPGFGMGSVVDPAVRDYDAVTVQVDRVFGGQWMAQASYTWSWLRGNEDGVFEPFTSWHNRNGTLPDDHTHSVKLFAGKEFALSGTTKVTVGGSYLGESGAPTSALGAHPFYGDGAVFLMPRGSGPRLPWVHSVDLHLGLVQSLPAGLTLHATLDAFNLFDFQAVTAIDERFTLSDARPLTCPPCTEDDLPGVVSPSGQAVVPNPSFRRPIAYQLPRTIRFGAKVAF